MASPFLFFADERLSHAELTAACLDGDLVELGEGYIPADAVETAALRAGSLARLLGSTLAATHLSAAWIHGALHLPPLRHTVQRAVTRRLTKDTARHAVYHDMAIAPEYLVIIGGVLVSAPARTLCDLVRVADAEYQHAARALVAQQPELCRQAIALLDTSIVPHKRSALVTLREWAAAGA